MTNQKQAEIGFKVATRAYGRAAVSALMMLLGVCLMAAAQRKTDSASSGAKYTNAKLALRYNPPGGMRDKTARFQMQIQDQSATPRTFRTLLAMSSGPNSGVPGWCSLTIVTYPRSAVSEPEDTKAAAQMNAWVAHSKDASALPKSVVISGQRFSVSLFGLQEGTVEKGAVVWTTVRKGQLLSFAFAANSPRQLTRLTESMKTLEFY